ncbi:ATP-dependent helicase/nuclease subunit [Dirofilaria immitis]
MGKLTESSDLANVLLIGDMNDSLLESLLANENSVSKQKNELLLDTKYYVARLKLISLKTVEAISEWKASASNLNVGAVIYNYDGEFCSMEKLKQQMSIWQTEIQVVVCKRLERSADWSDNLYHFCAAQQTELIELDPDAETIEDLNECHELYGIPRIWQVLEAGNWKDKIIKMNPLKSKEQRSFEKTGFPSSAAEKSSEDSFDDEESKLGDCDITEEDKEMILKLFGGPKVPFDSLMKDVDVPDPGVIEYFKQEMEKLKRQNKLAANKRRKKKKSKATVNEFGEFVDASNSTQMSNNVVTQNSSNVDSSNNEHVGIDVNVHEKNEEKIVQESSAGNFKDYAESSKKNSYELSNVAQSIIDELHDKSIDEHGTSLANKIHAARSALLKMPFGPERQNLAADTMTAVIKSIGDSDLFNSSSDDEPHT